MNPARPSQSSTQDKLMTVPTATEASAQPALRYQVPEELPRPRRRTGRAAGTGTLPKYPTMTSESS